MELSEGVHGHALLAITGKNAVQLVDILMGQAEGTTQSLGEMEQSCLEETGNIISGAFVNSWSNWLDIEIRPGVPQFVMQLPGAVLESVVADQALVGDEVLVAQTNFVLNDKAVEWVFMLFPAPSAMRLIEASCA